MDLKKILQAVETINLSVGTQSLKEKNIPIKTLLNSICSDLNQIILKIDGIDKIAKLSSAQMASSSHSQVENAIRGAENK